jgi:hypothetical protein
VRTRLRLGVVDTDEPWLTTVPPAQSVPGNALRRLPDGLEDNG